MRTKKLLFLILSLTFAVTACELLPEEGTVYGAWTCYETGPFGAATYMIDISESNSVPGEIHIANFSQLGFAISVTARVDGDNITIPRQTVNDGVSAFQISGSGYTTDEYKTMNWNYLLDGESYTATLSR